MIRYNRRRVLGRIGLGAGSLVLGSVADRLIARAYGQPTNRKSVVFFVVGGAMQTEHGTTGWGLQPPEVSGKFNNPELSGRTDFTWPRKLEPLKALRNKTVILDGLNNDVPGASPHTGGYVVLSCSPAGMGGITIDQALAQSIGRDTALGSILVGCNFASMKNKLQRDSTTFAAGPGRPLQHIVSLDLLTKELFGAGASGAPASSVSKPLLDSMRTDIRRLERSLAAEERGALGDYLKLIEQFEAQQVARAKVSCKAPTLGGGGSAEDLTKGMTQAITLAIQCGVTRVAGIAIGTGFEHEDMPVHAQVTGRSGRMDGHSITEDYSSYTGAVQKFHAGLIADMHRALGDDTVIVYLSDTGAAPGKNGQQSQFTHHGHPWRHPVVVVGTGGGALKLGGRYLRFGPKFRDKPAHATARPLSELYLSVAQAVGAPMKTFGAPSHPLPAKGPIPEIMA